MTDAATHTLLVLHIQPSAGFVLDCGDDTGGRLQLPADPQALVVADLDQDGHADVLVLHREPGLLSLAMAAPLDCWQQSHFRLAALRKRWLWPIYSTTAYLRSWC